MKLLHTLIQINTESSQPFGARLFIYIYTHIHNEHSAMLKHWISHTKISALLQSYLNDGILQTTKAFNSSAKGLLEEQLYEIKIQSRKSHSTAC